MSSEVIPIRKRATELTREDAERWIRASAPLSKNVGHADHARETMVERDISSRQVWEVLKGGSVIKDPEWDSEHEDWICLVRRRTSGRTVTVIVALEEKNKMTVVTTYG